MDFSAFIGTIWQQISAPRYGGVLNKLKKSAYKKISQPAIACFKSSEPIPFAEVDKLKFQPFSVGDDWGGFFDCAWFEFTCTLNAEDREKDNLVVILNLSGEGCVYNGDGPVQGLTNVMQSTDLFQTVIAKRMVPLNRIGFDKTSGEVKFWVDAGNNGRGGKSTGQASLKSAALYECREDCVALYYDIMTGYLACRNMNADAIAAGEKKRVTALLAKAISAVGRVSLEEVKKARYILADMYTGAAKPNFTIHAVGHAHLDLAWLWPIRETKRKSVRTFTNALYNIEKNPDYVFGASQPQQFEWMKNEYPALFEKIKVAIANGNIEAQGGMWVEPDTNIPCGESLIRQFYYGKRFWQEEFGKESNMLWVPDVFGYTAALPQIMKKCGTDNFMTIKLSWNAVNKFPYHTFNWEGLDGSRVLVHMPPEGDYNSTSSPHAISKIEKNYRERAISDIALMPFGAGDGGGGPGEYSVSVIPREEKLPGLPHVKFSTGEAFFKELAEGKDRYPSYKGELYLEKHRGTYTTQAKNKRSNRLTERFLHNAEWLSALASLNGKPYPRERLDKIWKEVLLYQFHDILPGSSINRVYAECKIAYKRLRSETGTLIEEALREFLGKEYAPSAVNPIGFKRKGFIKKDEKWYIYDVAPYSSGRLRECTIDSKKIKAENNRIENDILSVVFNDKGQVVELISKADGYDYAGGVIAAPRIYKDKKNHPYDAWDIDKNYVKIPPHDMKFTSGKAYIDGYAAVMENTYVYGGSAMTVRYVLTEGVPYLVAECTVGWHESHKMLRVDFYPKNFGDEVLCNIQFGNILRSTRTVESIEKEQFEIPAHKWVDVTANGRGLAVLNDCKYGHRVKDGLISLNCLRSPDYPDKTADRGDHRFTFAVYPHVGAAMDSDLLKAGYEVNNPLILTDKSARILPIAEVVGDGVILETVLATADGGVALRIYEAKGRPSRAALKINIRYESVAETDMLFKNPSPLSIPGDLEFGAFEVKTIVITPMVKPE
ncbi:MAG: hypothetical protein LBT55_04245 [Clostridiaceae bacterium]|jgi:alpha-mannosidase|nr:hypothetical protein [Clostridiaceae bacterium]